MHSAASALHPQHFPTDALLFPNMFSGLIKRNAGRRRKKRERREEQREGRSLEHHTQILVRSPHAAGGNRQINVSNFPERELREASPARAGLGSAIYRKLFTAVVSSSRTSNTV